MKYVGFIAFVAMLGAASAPLWLDLKTPVNWNVPGAPLPAAAAPKDAELAAGGRCASTLRPPGTPEDRALIAKGWSPVGPYQLYGGTSVVVAASSADGMCRPNAFQGFVFVNGVFAGTLSPRLMDSRTDGSLAGLGVQLENARDLAAQFVRYSDSDPLCCPHATTSVSYEIKRSGGHDVLAAQSAETGKNP